MRIIEGLSRAKELLYKYRGLELENMPPPVRAKLQEVFGEALTPLRAVERIIHRVRTSGDKALRELTRLLDGVELDCLEVSRERIDAAYERVPKELIEALKLAARRIRVFHEASKPKAWVDHKEGYGQMVVPIERVGVYVPGGTASYPSTVLMTAIPARVAGVKEIVQATPTRSEEGPNPAVLVASDIAGVDHIFQIGGAQAIAAMAYGTESIPQVDMVCGPGNVFVTLAKRLLYGQVGIDGLYGPTETMIIADDGADPDLCSVDLLAQGEHDTMAIAILITTSRSLAKAVEQRVEAQMASLERKEIAEVSLREKGYVVLVEELEQAIDLANHFAPEHLCLMVKDPWSHLDKIRNVGGVFLGGFSPEVMGDYTAGPSHAMPTGGTARFSSSLGVHSFLKLVPIVALNKKSFESQVKAASIIGRAEGLTGHAQAAEARMKLLERRDEGGEMP